MCEGKCKKNKRKCGCGKKRIAKSPARKINDKELFRLAKKIVDLKKLKKNLTKKIDKKIH